MGGNQIQSLTPVWSKFGWLSMLRQSRHRLHREYYCNVNWGVNKKEDKIDWNNKEQITYFSEVRVRLSFNAATIDSIPWGPRVLFHKLRVAINQIKQKRINQTDFNELKERFTFNASPIETPPSGPIWLEDNLREVKWRINLISHSLEDSQSVVHFQCFR